jgi:hypothetical protein
VIDLDTLSNSNSNVAGVAPIMATGDPATSLTRFKVEFVLRMRPEGLCLPDLRRMADVDWEDLVPVVEDLDREHKIVRFVGQVQAGDKLKQAYFYRWAPAVPPCPGSAEVTEPEPEPEPQRKDRFKPDSWSAKVSDEILEFLTTLGPLDFDEILLHLDVREREWVDRVLVRMHEVGLVEYMSATILGSDRRLLGIDLFHLPGQTPENTGRLRALAKAAGAAHGGARDAALDLEMSDAPGGTGDQEAHP